MFARICGIAAALFFFVSASAHAALTCTDIVGALSSALVDVNCFESSDLTTKNPATDNTATTPVNNSLPGLSAGAFTPATDRGVISPSKAADRTPITKAVP